MQTISITRALTELKRIDARIAQATLTGTFAATQVGKAEKAKVAGSTKSVADIRAEINASFQKVESLLVNRAAIKSAIVASNAVTIVELNGVKMTVADAIDLKATLPLRKTVLTEARAQLAAVRKGIEQNNAKLEADVQVQIQALLGADKAKQDPATLQMITDTQKNQREQSLIAEDFIVERVKKLEDEVLNIETELDFVLSESNALTTVQVAL